MRKAASTAPIQLPRPPTMQTAMARISTLYPASTTMFPRGRSTMAASPASMEPKAMATRAMVSESMPSMRAARLILGHAPERQPESRVVGEEPEESDDSHADPDHQQAVDSRPERPPMSTLPANEDGQGVGHALEPAPAQSLQDGQTDGIGGDDLGDGHAPHPDEDEPVDQGSDDPGSEDGNEALRQVVETQGCRKVQVMKPHTT